MKKQIIAISVLLITILIGCSKSSDTTVNPPETKGTISGIIKDANTNKAAAGITVTNSQLSQSTVTDANGSYTFSVAAGTYTLNITDPGYKTATIASLTVAAGNTVTGNLSITPISWSNPATTDNNANYVVPVTSNPNIQGTALSDGDLIGAFYDSTGTAACAGFKVWSGGNISITLWGDDGTTTKKEGFAGNEAITWKIKRKSDGKVFNATATYLSGTGIYASGGTVALSSLTGITK